MRLSPFRMMFLLLKFFSRSRDGKKPTFGTLLVSGHMMGLYHSIHQVSSILLQFPAVNRQASIMNELKVFNSHYLA